MVIGFIAFFGEFRALDTQGSVSIVLSVIVDFPSTATFLTPEERAYLIWRKSVLSQFLETRID